MNRTISKNLRLILSLALVLYPAAQADTRLVVNLAHLPSSEISTICNELMKDTSAQQLPTGATPGETSVHQIDAFMRKQLTPNLSGFRVFYAGYTTISDSNGLAVFPLRHTQSKVYIAVTANVKLVHVKGTTFSHGEYTPDQNAPLKLYKCEKLEDPNKKDYWKITKIDKPDRMRINPISVIIATHPDNVFIEEKDFMPYQGEQFVLPPIRIVGGQDKDSIELRLLDNKPHFEKIATQKKRSTDISTSTMITTY